MKLAAAKLPVTTEVIDRNTPPRVGFSEFPILDLGPRVITKGEHAAALELAATLEKGSEGSVDVEKITV